MIIHVLLMWTSVSCALWSFWSGIQMRELEKVHHNHQDTTLFYNSCKIWMLPFSAAFALWPLKRLMTWYFSHGCQYCKYLEIYFSFLCEICYVGLEDEAHRTQYSIHNSLQVEGHLSLSLGGLILWWVVLASVKSLPWAAEAALCCAAPITPLFSSSCQQGESWTLHGQI